MPVDCWIFLLIWHICWLVFCHELVSCEITFRSWGTALTYIQHFCEGRLDDAGGGRDDDFECSKIFLWEEDSHDNEQCCFWGRWWQQLPCHAMEWQQLPWQLLNCWIPVCTLLASSIWTRFALFLYSAVVATVPSPSKLSSSSTLYLAQRHFPPNHLKPLPLPLSFHCALQIKANHCPIPESTFFFFLFTDIDEDWRRQPGKMEITFQWDLHGPQSRQRRWYGRMSKE